MVTPKVYAMAQCRTHMSMAASVHLSWAGFGGSRALGRDLRPGV